MNDSIDRRLRLANWIFSGVMLGSLIGAPVANAQNTTPFYKGRTLTLGLPAGVGSSYDLYARAFARYLSTYIPGNPNIIVVNVPGGGGLVLANQLANTMPKDGTYIGIIPGPAMEYELIKDPQVRFSGKEFRWIGNMNRITQTCIVWTASGITSVDDFYKQEVTVGASAVGADSYTLPTAYKRLFGMKLRVITGYPAASDIMVAMAKGEVTGDCGIDIVQYRSQFESYIKNGQIALIAQAGIEKDPRYPDVPNMLDQAKTPESRHILELVFLPDLLGKAIAAPAETPEDRVEILRNGFMQVMKDPQFLAEMKTEQLDVQPMDHVEIEKAIRKMSAAPPEAVDALRSLLVQR